MNEEVKLGFIFVTFTIPRCFINVDARNNKKYKHTAYMYFNTCKYCISLLYFYKIQISNKKISPYATREKGSFSPCMETWRKKTKPIPSSCWFFFLSATEKRSWWSPRWPQLVQLAVFHRSIRETRRLFTADRRDSRRYRRGVLSPRARRSRAAALKRFRCLGIP